MADRVSVSVVVASHARHLRLLWLLNALEEQTLAPDGRSSSCTPTTRRLPRESSMPTHWRKPGVLRHEAVAPGTGSPSRQRNLGWRAARGEVVAFTDDDCRPEPGWLEALVAVARAQPGQVVQGTTRPDPLERAILVAPHVRTLRIEPVGPFAQTANILYPRMLLARLDGFDEAAVAGEDVQLSLRAKATGAMVVAAPAAVVNHAVESHTLPGIMRQNLKWRYLAYLVKQHPELRRDLTLRVFWDRDHLEMTAAMTGLVFGARRRVLLALALPYATRIVRHRARGRRLPILAVAELPGQAIRQGAEVVGMIAGSIRHRTVLL